MRDISQGKQCIYSRPKRVEGYDRISNTFPAEYNLLKVKLTELNLNLKINNLIKIYELKYNSGLLTIEEFNEILDELKKGVI